MERHAYLIMGHNNIPVLEKLLFLLDDPRNDIYLHIDKRFMNDEFTQLIKNVKKSSCILVPSLRVNWGGYSLFNCELQLLKNAIQKKYSYYHLLSGSDLPLRSQNIIHKYFRINNDKEFISLYIDIADQDQDANRWQYYHFFQNYIHRDDPSILNQILVKMEKVSLNLQMKLGVKRHPSLKIIKNANWFSITDSLARYIVSEEKKIKKMFRFTLHADEFVLSYLVMNSQFKDHIYLPGNMRYIDWNRGEPYIWHKNEYDEIMTSGKLFARKFDFTVDMDIVNKIYSKICEC